MRATSLYPLRINARRTCSGDACARLISLLVVHVLDVEGVDVAGEVSIIALEQCTCGKAERLQMHTYPRIVSKMLIRTSAPQPATRKTPTGGTGYG